MPTYQNRSGLMTSIGDWTFSPGEIKPISQQYLDLSLNPNIIKISDEPKLIQQFYPVLENISSAPSNCSKFISNIGAIIVSINDLDDPCPVGTEIDVSGFIGLTDNIVDYIHLKTITFKKIQIKDSSGNLISIWSTFDDIIIKSHILDTYHEFVCFNISRKTNSVGKINLLVKYFHGG